jgi:hypothetical protein
MMPDFPQKVVLKDVTAMFETEKAIKVLYDGDELWVPKSQIDDDSEVFQLHDRDGSQQTGKLVISKWFADKEKLEGDD